MTRVTNFSLLIDFFSRDFLFSENSVLGEHVKELVISTCGFINEKRKKNERFDVFFIFKRG
jgi:dihydrodipicolinate reductase